MGMVRNGSANHRKFEITETNQDRPISAISKLSQAAMTVLPSCQPQMI